MHIEEDMDWYKWVDETLEIISIQNPQTAQDRCPHCGLIIRYPIVVRRSDLVLFEETMKSAYSVMRRHGITANLLADIRTECLIATAKKRNIKEAHE
jgi:hypothetical protein